MFNMSLLKIYCLTNPHFLTPFALSFFIPIKKYRRVKRKLFFHPSILLLSLCYGKHSGRTERIIQSTCQIMININCTLLTKSILLILFFHFHFPSHAYDKAVISVPIADLLGQPAHNIYPEQSSDKSYNMLPVCGEKNNGYACPRLHQ